MRRPTDAEIQEAIDRTLDVEGTKYRGMTYEDGVREALDWVLGRIEEVDISWPYVDEEK